jgi:hypothetical protein
MMIRNLLSAALLGLTGLTGLMGLTGCDVPLQDYYELHSAYPPKGVAYDPGPQVFYTTALTGGAIEMVTSLGRAYPFYHLDEPGLALHGAVVDGDRLWVCAVAHDSPTAAPRGWLLGFGIEDRRLEVRVDLGALHPIGSASACEAVDVGDDGVVYAVDPIQPVVYRYDPKGNHAAILSRDPRFQSTGVRGLSGVAVAPAGDRLVVAFAVPAALYVVPLAEPDAPYPVSMRENPLGRPGDPRFPAAGGLTFVDDDLFVVFPGAVQRVRFTDAVGLRTARVHTTTAVPDGLSMAVAADGAAYAIDGDAFDVEVLGLDPEGPYSLVRVDQALFAADEARGGQ